MCNTRRSNRETKNCFVDPRRPVFRFKIGLEEDDDDDEKH